MKLRYLTPLVLSLVAGVAWSVQSYLEADRILRGELRPQRAEQPTAETPFAPLEAPTAWLRDPAPEPVQRSS